ncbi:MAG TPA: hypothetical protein VMN58_12995 [Acidimicrobiales bacterium]|nr:hypothetical protein [Acidimicrobiales bacterium]
MRPLRPARRLPALRAVVVATVVLGSVVGLGGCRSDTVRVTFRPEVGDTFRYEVRVRSTTEIHLTGAEPDVRSDDVLLTADHTVLEPADDGGVRVEVLLTEPGTTQRRFVVVFDRAAQLAEVESIEGVPDELLGSLGIPEIFPAAAGAAPNAPLGPGARWRIDDEVVLPGSPHPARLTGDGRLVELGVVDGADVARLTTTSRVEVGAGGGFNGAARLDGVQETRYTAVHDLADGAVRRSSSRTTGTFDLSLGPPSGTFSDPVSGTLVVLVESETRRL